MPVVRAGLANVDAYALGPYVNLKALFASEGAPSRGRCNAYGRPALGDLEKAELARRMLLVEPSPLLSFLIPMGADPVARELARGG